MNIQLNKKCTVSLVNDKPIVKIHNAVLHWCFLDTPSEMSKKFQVTFCPTGAEGELENLMLEFFSENCPKKKLSPQWLGGKKLLNSNDENSPVSFTAKLSPTATTEKTDEKTDKAQIENRIVPVFDGRNNNQKFNPVPKIANGAIANLVLWLSVQPDLSGKQFGVSLYIKQVQLIDWTEYTTTCSFDPIDQEIDAIDQENKKMSPKLAETLNEMSEDELEKMSEMLNEAKKRQIWNFYNEANTVPLNEFEALIED